MTGAVAVVAAICVGAGSAAAAKVEFSPSPILFATETESKNGGFYLEGPGEALAKEIKIVAGKDMTHFSVKAECGGSALPVTLKEAGVGKYELPPGSGIKKETVEMAQPNP